MTEIINKQLHTGLTYATSSYWSLPVAEKASKALLNTTDNKMAAVYLGSSGSGAMEVAIKTGFQYFHFKGELQRKFIISLKPSWHGTTGIAINVSNMISRDRFYVHLKQSIYKAIPSFNSYHHKMTGESEESYLRRLLAQFEKVLLE